MKIRAVTFYLNPSSWEPKFLRNYVEHMTCSLHEALDSVKSEYEVWSLRLSTPPPPRDLDRIKAAEVVYKTSKSSGINLVSGFLLGAEEADPGLLRGLLEVGVYVGFKVTGEDDFKRLSETIVKVSRENPILLVRTAVTLGDVKSLLTPYFPLSVNTRFREGLAIALLYPTDLLKAYQSGGFKHLTKEASRLISEASNFGEKLSSKLKVEFYGVDCSISPWMDESSALLVEEVLGSRIGEPGSIAAVARLNRAILSALSSINVKATGFCELMLPVAEDDVLKRRVWEGHLKLRDLIALSSACVAGVDMAVIPINGAMQIITKVLKDVSWLSKLKGKPQGVRLIPYPGVEPGDFVDLDVFGKTPVISP